MTESGARADKASAAERIHVSFIGGNPSEQGNQYAGFCLLFPRNPSAIKTFVEEGSYDYHSVDFPNNHKLTYQTITEGERTSLAKFTFVPPTMHITMIRFKLIEGANVDLWDFPWPFRAADDETIQL
jgi:hypothetical protein